MAELPVYDGLVLSGGGAKGAYGAGAAKALYAYRLKKKVNHRLFFVGVSVGALNAAVLAAGGAEGSDALVHLWRSMRNHQVLGVLIKNAKFQGAKNWVKGALSGQPYHIYSSAALLKLIHDNTSFSKLANSDSPLIIAATNFTEGSLVAFYHSSILEEFVDDERRHPEALRRLSHFKPLTETSFHSCLLASASIPVFFPPIKIDENLYIDGGVGNNTPTREAAYFLRFLEQNGKGKAGEVYCVRLDPPRSRADGRVDGSLLGIVDRALSIYHHVHTTPIVTAWFQINRKVADDEQRMQAFTEWVNSQQFDNGFKAELLRRGDDVVHFKGASRQINVPIQIVEPSTPLGETLDFAPTTIKSSIEAGYIDMLRVLQSAGRIDDVEHSILLNEPIFPQN